MNLSINRLELFVAYTEKKFDPQREFLQKYDSKKLEKQFDCKIDQLLKVMIIVWAKDSNETFINKTNEQNDNSFLTFTADSIQTILQLGHTDEILDIVKQLTVINRKRGYEVGFDFYHLAFDDTKETVLKVFVKSTKNNDFNHIIGPINEDNLILGLNNLMLSYPTFGREGITPEDVVTSMMTKLAAGILKRYKDDIVTEV